MDLSKLSLDELRNLQKHAAKEIESRAHQIKAEAIQKIQQIAQAAGISLTEVTGAQRTKKSSTAKVKYRDPDNPANTWAGRGRKPRWLEEKVRRGKKIDDFAV